MCVPIAPPPERSLSNNFALNVYTYRKNSIYLYKRSSMQSPSLYQLKLKIEFWWIKKMKKRIQNLRIILTINVWATEY